MRILNLSLLFVFFLLVVGPHSPRPISCVFSDADVCNEREHLGAPQRKHSNSTITRATMLNDFEQKIIIIINARKQIERSQSLVLSFKRIKQMRHSQSHMYTSINTAGRTQNTQSGEICTLLLLVNILQHILS